MSRQTKVDNILGSRAPSLMLLLLLLLSLAEAAPSQTGAAPSSAPSGDNPGQATQPSTAATPQMPQPEQPKAPAEAISKTRQPASQPATKTLELTGFQQFAAQSLGYVLPIYGASLFDNAPTTFAESP